MTKKLGEQHGMMLGLAPVGAATQRSKDRLSCTNAGNSLPDHGPDLVLSFLGLILDIISWLFFAVR